MTCKWGYNDLNDTWVSDCSLFYHDIDFVVDNGMECPYCGKEIEIE